MWEDDEVMGLTAVDDHLAQSLGQVPGGTWCLESDAEAKDCQPATFYGWFAARRIRQVEAERRVSLVRGEPASGTYGCCGLLGPSIASRTAIRSKRVNYRL